MRAYRAPCGNFWHKYAGGIDDQCVRSHVYSLPGHGVECGGTGCTNCDYGSVFKGSDENGIAGRRVYQRVLGMWGYFTSWGCHWRYETVGFAGKKSSFHRFGCDCWTWTDPGGKDV